jgi:2-amino-4-hydroxy-6-hydroxymethyldihydropteridine diphosphokinase
MINAAQSVTVILGLGSNLGDRRANLDEAVRRVEAMGVEIVAESSVYETEPVGYIDQPWFLNQVIEARLDAGSAFESDEEMKSLVEEAARIDPGAASLPRAQALLAALLRIERDMGRKRVMDDGPRIIDIDLLLFGSLIIACAKDGAGFARAGVIVPHPRMHLRRFVLEPVCEIAPDLVHPSTGKTMREMLDALDDPSVVRLYESRHH